MTQTISGVGDSLWVKRSSGLGVLVARRRFPINGLVFYAPLWHPQLNTSPFNAWDIANGAVHSCTVADATWGVTGRTFDGTDSLITVSAASAFANLFDGGGTAIAWINAAGIGENSAGRIFHKQVGWNLHIKGDEGTTCDLRSDHDFDGTDGQWQTDPAVITYGTPVMVTITYDNGHVNNNPTFYINTTAKTVGSGVTEVKTPVGTRVDDSASVLYIGNDPTKIVTFNGIIGEQWLFNRSLTSLEIQHIFETTKWRYQ